MKRLFSIVMALILMLSLSITVFADANTDTNTNTNTPDGSITITNPTKNHTYKLYKIFDATYSSTGAVSYTIKKDSQFFPSLFGNGENEYFTYDPDNGYVERKKDTLPGVIIGYLAEMVKTGSYSPDKTMIASDEYLAEDKTLTFTDLPYGYYLIDKGTNAAVTITSNTPNVDVIDKTQVPGENFTKKVYDEEMRVWETDTSANIGDLLNFKVEFVATNYHGEKQIKYYTIDDKKGDALWVDFDTITVKVGNETLGMGYYHFAGADTDGANTGEWTPATNSDKWTKNSSEAEWFLIHYDLDNFDIVIPWMTGYTFTGSDNGFSMEYAGNSTAKFDSPVDVTVEYSAGVEANAVIGGGQYNNVWNQAELFWTSDMTDGPGDPELTTATVYGLGLDKIDGDAAVHTHLAGAVFELYRDDKGTVPVNVIPTNIEGVYVLDDPTPLPVDDQNFQSARKLYSYKGDPSNKVTTQINGKLVVLGLEEGEYYLIETQAPDGYNILQKLVTVEVGETSTTYTIIADGDGKVYNTQEVGKGQHRHLYTVTSITVENSMGVELPSTGGTGTMMMLSIGTMIAILFAVLLITHKKMSIYHD